MGDTPERTPEHTPEEEAAFNERVGEMAGYAELLSLEDQGLAEEERAEKDRFTQGIDDPIVRSQERDRVEERYSVRRSRIWWAIGIILAVILLAVGAFYFTSGEDLTAGSSASGESDAAGTDAEQASADVPGGAVSEPGEVTSDGVVSGTWIVYADEAKSMALYELTFQPNGAAVFLPEAPPIEYTTDSWSYTQDGESVEVEIKQHVSDPEFGVNEPSDAWLHLTLTDGVMTGTWEQDVVGYETVGDTAGTVYRHGVQEMGTVVYAEPQAPS